MPKVYIKHYEIGPGDSCEIPVKGQHIQTWLDPREDRRGHLISAIMFVEEDVITNAKVVTMPKPPGRG